MPKYIKYFVVACCYIQLEIDKLREGITLFSLVSDLWVW